jgi:hypothetical protein
MDGRIWVGMMGSIGGSQGTRAGRTSPGVGPTVAGVASTAAWVLQVVHGSKNWAPYSHVRCFRIPTLGKVVQVPELAAIWYPICSPRMLHESVRTYSPPYGVPI